jgi:hypothetical protein
MSEIVEHEVTGRLVPFEPTSTTEGEPADPGGSRTVWRARSMSWSRDPNLARRWEAMVASKSSNDSAGPQQGAVRVRSLPDCWGDTTLRAVTNRVFGLCSSLGNGHIMC